MGHVDEAKRILAEAGAARETEWARTRMEPGLSPDTPQRKPGQPTPGAPPTESDALKREMYEQMLAAERDRSNE